MSYAALIGENAKTNSVSSPIPGRTDMVENNTGGFTFALDCWGLLDRFLILGTDKPSYYASAGKQTNDAVKIILGAINADGVRAVKRIVEISVSGRAPKNDPAVAALALAAIHGNAETVSLAYESLPKVARTGTHLFQFVEMLDKFGKWNAAAKRGIANWYGSRTIERLAVQLLKYQSRNGWSHRDVLRLAHVKPQSEAHNALYRYVTAGKLAVEVSPDSQYASYNVPELIYVYESLKAFPTKEHALSLIKAGHDLTWEMIPTQLHRDPDVMSALLPNMGVTAVIRKLGQLTDIGVIAKGSEGTQLVNNLLSNTEALKAGRIHPITILNAFNQYNKGRGDKGSLTWTPVKSVADALDDAFYEAFQFIEATGENYWLCVDCSGSMFSNTVTGTPNLTAAQVAGVTALAIAKREPNHSIFGFSRSIGELKISPDMRLSKVLSVIEQFNWSTTNLAAPWDHAISTKSVVDKLISITDNETNCGRHPKVALDEYRRRFNQRAKNIVCGTSVTSFTVADPTDVGSLDIVGFDSAAPQLIQQF